MCAKFSVKFVLIWVSITALMIKKVDVFIIDVNKREWVVLSHNGLMQVLFLFLFYKIVSFWIQFISLFQQIIGPDMFIIFQEKKWNEWTKLNLGNNKFRCHELILKISYVGCNKISWHGQKPPTFNKLELLSWIL